MDTKKMLGEIGTKLKTVGLLLWSKGVAIMLLVILMFQYLALSSDEPTPFAELFYVVILVASVIVIAPVVRLLVFAEAAEVAESGKLKELLKEQRFYPRLVHYWIATLISYGVTLLCVSSLLS